MRMTAERVRQRMRLHPNPSLWLFHRVSGDCQEVSVLGQDEIAPLGHNEIKIKQK